MEPSAAPRGHAYHQKINKFENIEMEINYDQWYLFLQNLPELLPGPIVIAKPLTWHVLAVLSFFY